MTAYNTGNPIGSTDPRDLSDNAQDFDQAIVGAETTWTDRLGNTRISLRGQIGYTGTGTDGAIQSYTSGLVLSGYNVIILYSGEFYRPSASATLPYTTTATLPDVDSNLVSIGDANLRQDLAGNPADGLGAALVNGAVIRVTSIAAMESYSAPVGYVFSLNAGGRSGVFDVVAGDFSTELAADTLNGVYVGLSDNPTATTKVAKRRYSGDLVSKWFGVLGDGSNEYAKIVAVESYVFFNKENILFPAGIYDVGNNNFPFRNTSITPLKNYAGVRVYGQGSGTVFRTTSDDGADVLQLNAVQGISIDSLKITAIKTETTGAGSNGVSITNGGKDIYVDVICEDLPYVDAGSFIDGGKAASIQPSTTVNEVENIKINVVAKNVAYGFGMDINNDNLINKPMKGIDVKVFCDTAYRGVVLSGTASASTVPSNGLDWGVRIRGTTINCQQHYVSNRAWNADVDLHCVNTTNSLDGYLAVDTETFVDSILGSKNEITTITGQVLTVDVVHRIGATTNGGGVSGSTENAKITLNLDFQTATTQFDYVNSGGNTASKTVFEVNNLTTVPFGDIVLGNNTLVSGHQIRTKDFRNYNTFEHFNASDVKKFGIRPDGNIESPLTSSSAIGAYVGKKAEYDAAGTFIGFRAIYG